MPGDIITGLSKSPWFYCIVVYYVSLLTWVIVKSKVSKQTIWYYYRRHCRLRVPTYTVTPAENDFPLDVSNVMKTSSRSRLLNTRTRLLLLLSIDTTPVYEVNSLIIPNEWQQVSLGFGERVTVRGRRQLANEFRQTRFLDGVDQFHSGRVRFGCE